MALPLKRVQLAQYQRVDETDGDNFGAFALDALYQTLKACFAPSSGWLTLGVLNPIGGLNLVLEAPTAAITAQGLAILANDAGFTISPNNHISGNPRIDLVSIGWQEIDSDEQERQFINPGDDSLFPDDTFTTKTWRPIGDTVTITQGAPDVSPVPPATPTNHVPLYYVRVENGAAVLTADKLTPVPSSASKGGPQFAAASWTGPSVASVPLPWISGTLLSFASRGAFTVILATVTVMIEGSHDPSIQYDPIMVQIEDSATGAIVGATERDLFSGEQATIVVVGYIAGATAGARNYRMRVKRAADYPPTANTLTIIVTPKHLELTNVQNVIAAISF